MSYTLTVVNRTPITIQNGATDSSTSLTLVGKNYPNYGQIIEQDLIYLMQNFAGGSQPVNPVTGQLWWSTTSNNLQVYNGTTFKTIGGATVSTSAPTSSSIAGDLWYKSDDAQLYLYNGSSWLLIGPNYTSSQQQTNATALTITDNTSSTHTVLAFYVGNTLTGILSKDATFTPQSPITGFATILPGYNVNSTIFAGNITISGTIIQNAQPYITSLGTLTGLTVTAPIVGSVLYNANTVIYSSQPNITSVGTLTSLTSSGTVLAPNVTSTLNGAIGTAAPNVATFTNATVNNRLVQNVYTAGSVGATYTVDWSASNFYTLTLTASCALTFTNPPASGKEQTLTIVTTQGGSGSYTLSYPAAVRWANGVAPTLTTTVSYRDVLQFVTYDGGTSYLGRAIWSNVAP
jgi:hypothetical protein